MGFFSSLLNFAAKMRAIVKRRKAEMRRKIIIIALAVMFFTLPALMPSFLPAKPSVAPQNTAVKSSQSESGAKVLDIYQFNQAIQDFASVLQSVQSDISRFQEKGAAYYKKSANPQELISSFLQAIKLRPNKYILRRLIEISGVAKKYPLSHGRGLLAGVLAGRQTDRVPELAGPRDRRRGIQLASHHGY